MGAIVNKKQIESLKNDHELFYDLVANQKDNLIIYTLKNLGKLENENTLDVLLRLTNSGNSKIRTLSIKNLGKLKNISLLNLFVKHGNKDSCSDVRRESISAIGRLRNEKAIPVLVEFLSDKDPKVVMQAIRGLLVFSKKKSVAKELKKLAAHPNELIREIVNKAFNGAGNKANCLGKSEERRLSLKNLVVCGDTRRALKYIPEESIHLTFTSPPYYNARDYSIYQSYEEYCSDALEIDSFLSENS